MLDYVVRCRKDYCENLFYSDAIVQMRAYRGFRCSQRSDRMPNLLNDLISVRLPFSMKFYLIKGNEVKMEEMLGLDSLEE